MISVAETAQRDAWLIERQNSIGASDAAAILGYGYAGHNAATVWLDKTHPDLDANQPTEDDLKRFKFGQIMEPAILSLFEEETGLVAVDTGKYTVRHHPDYPWLSATLDSVTCDDDGDAIIEAKNVGAHNIADWKDEPPLKFLVQIQQQMAVAGFDHGYLTALLGGFDTITHRIERNDKFIDALIERLGTWWEMYVIGGEFPPIDDNPATARVLRLLHPDDSGDAIALSSESQDWMEKMAAAKVVIKEAKGHEQEAKNNLMASLGNATYGEFPDGRACSWKTQTRKEYTVKESTTRVFRVAARLPKGIFVEE